MGLATLNNENELVSTWYHSDTIRAVYPNGAGTTLCIRHSRLDVGHNQAGSKAVI